MKTTEITLRIRWNPKEHDDPADWKWTDLTGFLSPENADRGEPTVEVVFAEPAEPRRCPDCRALVYYCKTCDDWFHVKKVSCFLSGGACKHRRPRALTSSA